MSLLLFSGAGQGVRTSALIIQLLTLLSERVSQREGGCSGETADNVVYQSFIKPARCHRRVTTDFGSVSCPGCPQAEKNHGICRQSVMYEDRA